MPGENEKEIKGKEAHTSLQIKGKEPLIGCHLAFTKSDSEFDFESVLRFRVSFLTINKMYRADMQN